MLKIDTLVCQDIDHLNEAVSGTELDNFQLSKGKFSGNISHIDLGKTFLDTGFYTQKILAKGSFSKDKITFASLLKEGDEQSIFRSKELKADGILCLSEESEMSFIGASNSKWSTFQVPREELEVLGFDIQTFSDMMINQSPIQAQNSSRDLHKLLTELSIFGNDETSFINKDAVYERVLSAYLTGFNDTKKLIRLDKNTSKSIACRVYDYINAHPNETITSYELCRVTQKSERTLQRSF